MNTKTTYKITKEYIAISIIAVFLTFFFHEAAHFIMGKALGYDMWFSMNAVGLNEVQNYSKEWHGQLVAIAGPVVTILQAIVFFMIIKKTRKIKWYPFVFIAALMRLFAALISGFINPNDEARVSEWLGIGKMTLPIIVSLSLIYLVINISKSLNIKWKFNIATYIVMSLGITSVVFLNQYFIK
ncbi:hypothetical protein [Winogradskyella forsetii]|uniref:hypothetical protein n=1 Tax=Winogradskyella forsetii TaxID=2686077 RepID=UPI0015B9150D|nr:hypothetical protein [Winogradskyella forsetii]